ncbi:MAG: hypothetical protein IJS68_03275 [Clostridia bacterium]|nr:hypothetical protein [Clostridia bacterium]
MADRFCSECNVSVAQDLSNCPLCGKYLLKKGEDTREDKFSYPIYNYSFVQRERVLKAFRLLAVLAIFLCVFINLIFITTPLWFPYAVVPIFCIYMAFVHPLRKNGNLIRRLPESSFYVSIMLIFIDAYSAIIFGRPFGWAYSIVVPLLIGAVSIVIGIIACTRNRYNMSLAKRSFYVVVASVIYFAVKVFAFRTLLTWPSVVMLCVSFGMWFLVSVFKPTSIAKEMRKDWHI